VSTWVLVPCHRPRLTELRASLVNLGLPAERTVVVTTEPEPIGPTQVKAAAVLLSPEPAINISRWWNLGLDWIAAQHEPGEPYEVLCMESDVRITFETLARLHLALRMKRLAMVGADWYGVAQEPVEIRRDLVPETIQHRIPGVCMLVAGELGLRFDEQFRWWYADDDFEWQHRKAGGTGLVRGTMIGHGPGRVLTGELAQYAAEDYQRFVAKWGASNIR
jgi:hypothetical protein